MLVLHVELVMAGGGIVCEVVWEAGEGMQRPVRVRRNQWLKSCGGRG